MTSEISGVLPIAHTPFLNDDTIDIVSLRRQIDWAYEQGASGFCTGMVSELLRLTAGERVDLTRELAQINAGRGVFIAGVGAESTKQAVEFANAAQTAGATGLMAIPPISSALSEDHLIDYFSALASATRLPLIVQDASSYVGQAIPVSVCQILLDNFGSDQILFKPEAAPLGPNLSALRDATDGRARIFEGSGGISLIDSFRRGIAGTMPGMEFLPGIVAIWKALHAGDDNRAYQVYFPLCALVALQLQAGLDGFLAVEKYVLHKQGLFTTDIRRSPYKWDLDRETQAEVDRLLVILEQAWSDD
ncbi:MAG: dihydrodipicolinate synthase family protein [Fuerstiella sp.]|jgi:4-hydroxy-tetrahydrodipicolinate synthase|nr:dihydrodipicolinate synthase family protein [Fuerstiella sp.]MCP4511349.1 dihydrodipicolinate synthase family protein [Fuerstiella sp.]MDG2130108.1 dihydrodipicolinate synthase family protein [Fuerstiella sp.]